MLGKLLAPASALAAVVLFSSPAAAIPVVGVPVESLYSNTVVDDLLYPDGSFGFYIPLSGSTETYGVSGGGLSSDMCNTYPGCSGGSLIIYLKYTPVTPGANLVTLYFNDLDIAGANDPYGFFESMKFYSSSNVLLADIDSVYDAGVVSYDAQNQVIQILVEGVTDPFRAKLKLKTSGSIPKYAYNTKEKLLTTIAPAPVPLPAALPLLGSALIGLGLIGRRRAKTGGGRTVAGG